MKLSRGTSAFIVGTALAGSLAGAAIAPALAGSAPASHASQRVACSRTEDSYLTDCHGHRLAYRHGGWFARGGVPAWLHAEPAPRWVALDACGRWPQFGLGKGRRGQVVAAAEVWPVNGKGRQTSDGFVACESGKVSLP